MGLRDVVPDLALSRPGLLLVCALRFLVVVRLAYRLIRAVLLTDTSQDVDAGSGSVDAPIRCLLHMDT